MTWSRMLSALTLSRQKDNRMRTPLFPYVSELYLRILFWIALGSLLALALLPSPTVEEFMLFSDKVMHALAFSVLATLGFWSYPKRIVYVVIGLLLYGALIEFFQALTETRAPEWADWLSDALGILIALSLINVRRYLFA